MQMPNGYEQASENAAIMGITPGGHKCAIMSVTEEVSSKGNEYIKVFIDTTKDDTVPNYYGKRYKEDTRPDKKWSGVMCVFTLGQDGYTNPQFKAFCTSVERSNPGFKISWGDGFCASLRGKLIGIVFREEEYQKSDNTIGTSVKPAWACEYAKTAEQKVPATKKMKQPVHGGYGFAPSISNTPENPNPFGFAGNNAPKMVEIKGDDDLPF